MNKLFTAGLAAAFATASSLAILASGVNAPTTQPGFLSAAPAFALADNDHGNGKHHTNNEDHNNGNNDDENNEHGNNDNENNEHGNNGWSNDCVNPAGHKKGWCKGHGNYRGHGGNYGNTTISGTVTGINGNTISLLQSNGQTITVVDNNAGSLHVGQHISLRGSYVNGQFVVGATNGNGNGYGYGGNGNGNCGQTVSGNIMGTGNGTVTLLGVPPITINVQQAINNNQTNGNLSIGRHITAYGCNNGGTFYASAIQ